MVGLPVMIARGLAHQRQVAHLLAEAVEFARLAKLIDIAAIYDEARRSPSANPSRKHSRHTSTTVATAIAGPINEV